MFDKNTFKDQFKHWAQRHPQATEEEAMDFCRSLVPITVYASHYWLVEQSVSWFKWYKSVRKESHSGLFTAEDMGEE